MFFFVSVFLLSLCATRGLLRFQTPTALRHHRHRLPPLESELQVYSTSGCRYCRLAKATLQEQGIPFRSIDITSHASVADSSEAWSLIEQRVAFTKQRTVPQIFVGKEHIGGCDDLLREMADGQLEKRLTQWGVERQGKHPPVSPATSTSDPADVDEAAAAPLRKQLLYLNEAAADPMPAPGASWPSQSPEAAQACVDLSVAVQHAALGLTDTFAASSAGGGVEFIDYRRMTLSLQYRAFSDMVAGLATLRLSTLSFMPPHSKTAFWVNVYNALVIHSTAIVGSPADSPPARSAFFSGRTGARYCVAGLLLSPDDIEHGVLRANALHAPPSDISSTGARPAAAPYFSTRQAMYLDHVQGEVHGGPMAEAQQPRCSVLQHTSADQRVGLCVPVADPRVHFVLNCGARSCPPVRVLAGAAADVEASLAAAAAAYLGGGEVSVSAEGRVVLPKLLLWYGGDFAPSLRGVCERVCALMRPGPEREALKEALRAGGNMEKLVSFGEYSWAPTTYN